MSFIESIKICLKKYGSFKGRASISEFWYFNLFYYSIFFIPIIISKFTYGDSNKVNFLTLISVISMFVLIPPYISVTVRRLHDINKSGYWYFLHVIPFLGMIIIFIICSLPGIKGLNKYDS